MSMLLPPTQLHAIGIRFLLHCFRSLLRYTLLLRCPESPASPSPPPLTSLKKFTFSWPHSLFLFLFYFFFQLTLVAVFLSVYLLSMMRSDAELRSPLSGSGNGNEIGNGNRNLIGSIVGEKDEVLGNNNVKEPPDSELVDYVEKDPKGRYIRVFFMLHTFFTIFPEFDRSRIMSDDVSVSALKSCHLELVIYKTTQF